MKKQIIIGCLFFASCVSIDERLIENKSYPSISYKEPSCQIRTRETAHFLVKACDYQTADKYASLAERFYDRVMRDTGLYSFVPQKPYEIAVYKDKSEYLVSSSAKKWSGAVTLGNVILTYPSQSPESIMAHEITHLILNEFLEDYSAPFAYIAEGLAVYQERQASSEVDLYYRNIITGKVKTSPIPFLEMAALNPIKSDKSDYISKWYAQCSSIVEYLIKREGAFRFSIFLKNIKKGYDSDSALKDAYPGIFSDYKDLEKKWLSWL